ncbi:MAG: murein biosynthesis integral membrane protein MurJ [Proteobacteria bacterium]|nr:murein biosynthesis integral membrane protein MurJ [Pseudomonadota bacterium]
MSLARKYTLVGSATLASRLTGFLRDILIAAVLGSSAVADAYIAAFLLPNLFRRVLSEGAFNAAFIPIYARRKAEAGEESVAAFTEHALSSLVAVVFLALIVAELLMPQVIGLLTPGFRDAPEKFAQAVIFGRIAFVFVAAIIVVALLASILNAMGRYGLVAVAPLILNFMLIGVLIALIALGWRGDYRAGLALVITVLVAGLVQLFFVAHGLRRAGAPVRLGWPQPDRDVKKLLMLMLPGLMLAGAGHFNMVVAAQLSSALPSAVSWLYYADRIFQLPLGFVAAAIGTVLLPEVARSFREGNTAAAEAAGNRALEFGLLLVLPAAVSLSILADPIVDIIYRRGAFSAADSVATAEVLRAIAIGLPGFVLVQVLLPPYLAREHFGLPLAAALAGIIANIAVTIALLSRLGAVAAPIGVAVSAFVNAAILALGLKRERLFGLDATARSVLPRVIASAAVTGGVTYGLAVLLGPLLASDQAIVVRIAALGIICASGVAVHGLAAHWLGAADLAAIKTLIVKRTA